MSGLSIDRREVNTQTVHTRLQTVSLDEIDAEDVITLDDEETVSSLMEAFDQEMHDNNLKPNSRRNYRVATKHLFHIVAHHDGDMVEELDSDRLTDYLKEMAHPTPDDDTEVRPFGDKTVEGRRNGWSAFYDFLRSRTEFDGTPVKGVDLSFTDGETKMSQELPDSEFFAVSKEQMNTLANHVSDTKPLRDEVLIRLTFDTGARVSEIVRLRMDDHVDLDDWEVTIPDVKTKSRTLPIEDGTCRRVMKRYLDTYWRTLPGVPNDSPYLFPSERMNDPANGVYNHLSESRAKDVVRDAAERSGLRYEYGTDKKGHTRTVPTFHSLRHGYAIESVRRGRNLYDLKYALGHYEMESTLRYLEALSEERTERLRRTAPTSGDGELDVEMTRSVEIDPSVYVGGGPNGL